MIDTIWLTFAPQFADRSLCAVHNNMKPIKKEKNPSFFMQKNYFILLKYLDKELFRCKVGIHLGLLGISSFQKITTVLCLILNIVL